MFPKYIPPASDTILEKLWRPGVDRNQTSGILKLSLWTSCQSLLPGLWIYSGYCLFVPRKDWCFFSESCCSNYGRARQRKRRRKRDRGREEREKRKKISKEKNILVISELKWTGMGEFNSDDHYIYYCGQESHRRNGVAIIDNKTPKHSTWMQSQKWQNDLCSFPKQAIQYHRNPSPCPKQ